MIKQFIPNKQVISLLLLFVLGSTTLIGTDSTSGADTWLSIGIAMVLSFPILMLYAKLLRAFPEKNLFDIIEYVFGKYIGKIISLLYVWYSFHLASLVIRNFGDFIRVVSFNKTPIIVTMAFITLLCIWGAKSGIETLCRWSRLGAVFVTIVAITAVSLASPSMDLNHIRPVLYNGIRPVLNSAFSIFTFPFAELVIVLIVSPVFLNPKSSYKIFLWALLLSGIFLISVTFFEISLIGDSYNEILFPTYSASNKIKIAGFIERIEVMVTMNILISGFIKICLCTIGMSSGIVHIFKLQDYKIAVAPSGLMILNLAYFIYPDTHDMFEWAFSTYRYYALLFQVILPIVIGIGIFIKLKIINIPIK
ncbi:endospore germination permease [Clostridiaceae bacterium M8S5]|nr:endospore germination permease [Clostridiaceae bacterium M8S5]